MDQELEAVCAPYKALLFVKPALRKMPNFRDDKILNRPLDAKDTGWFNLIRIGKINIYLFDYFTYFYI
jgi:hypothetical protein